MSTWLTEKEYRQSGAIAAGMTINAAFMDEIKTDFDFRSALNRSYYWINQKPDASPRLVVQWLCDLRDQLETYFALEEFYGYFQNAEVQNPAVSHSAELLRDEHEHLFLQLNDCVDAMEQIVYHECPIENAFDKAAENFQSFLSRLQRHENREMELVMRLHNEEIGVGD